MKKKIKLSQITAIIILVIVAFFVGRQTAPEKTTIQIVEKASSKKENFLLKNNNLKIEEKTLSDGTYTKVTTDLGREVAASNESSSVEKKSLIEKSFKKWNWGIGVGVTFAGQFDSAKFEKRILGDSSLALWGRKNSAGVEATFRF